MKDTKEGSNVETGVLYSSNSDGTKFTISLEDVNLIDDYVADVFKPANMDYTLFANKRI